MAIYAFYPFTPEGTATSIESAEFDSDHDATAYASRVLDQHATCAYVKVWCGERLVITRYRCASTGVEQGDDGVV